MYFTDFIQAEIKEFLQEEYPIYFYWDRSMIPDHPYIVYQTEDLELPDKLNTEYLRLLNSATKIYDYSELNQSINNSEFKPFLPNLNSTQSKEEKEIDVLFYGLITSRRQQIIDSLQLNVTYKQNLTYDEMRNLIPKSKWVLSIGSASNIHNDLLRVTPILNLGGNVMLESTQEQWYDDFLKENFIDRIQFI
jgi:hypothetical protein